MWSLIIFATASAATCTDSLYITRSFSADPTTSFSQSIIIINQPASAASLHRWLARPSNNRISPQPARPTSNCDWLPARWRPASRDPRAIRLAASEDRTLEALANQIWPDAATSVAAYVTSSYASMTYSVSVCLRSHDITCSCPSRPRPLPVSQPSAGKRIVNGQQYTVCNVIDTLYWTHQQKLCLVLLFLITFITLVGRLSFSSLHTKCRHFRQHGNELKCCMFIAIGWCSQRLVYYCYWDINSF